MSKSRPDWEYSLAILAWLAVGCLEWIMKKLRLLRDWESQGNTCNYCMAWFSHEPVYSKKDKARLIPFCSDEHCELGEKGVKEWPE